MSPETKLFMDYLFELQEELHAKCREKISSYKNAGSIEEKKKYILEAEKLLAQAQITVQIRGKLISLL